MSMSGGAIPKELWDNALRAESSNRGKNYRLDISFPAHKATQLISILETFIRNVTDAISTSEETGQNITLTCSIDTELKQLTSSEIFQKLQEK